MRRVLIAVAIAAWGLVPQIASAQFAYTWDATFESQPADSEGAKLGASRIRDLKKATSEREKIDHSWAGDANDGKHLQSTYRVSAAKPTLSSTDGAVYTKTVSGHTELFYEREDGTEVQVTINGLVVGAWSTGDVKVTLKTVADSGWVLMNDGTIGDATSGGTTRANADTSALFTLVWTNCVNADCAVSTGRGANAAADYAAHKTIALPKALGRALAVYGSGSGLTARVLGHVLGEEAHVQTTAEMAVHTPSSSVSTTVTPVYHDTDSGGTASSFRGTQATNSTGPGAINNDRTDSVVTATASSSFTGNSVGSGTAFNVMQPTTFLNIMIKL